MLLVAESDAVFGVSFLPETVSDRNRGQSDSSQSRRTHAHHSVSCRPVPTMEINWIDATLYIQRRPTAPDVIELNVRPEPVTGVDGGLIKYHSRDEGPELFPYSERIKPTA